MSAQPPDNYDAFLSRLDAATTSLSARAAALDKALAAVSLLLGPYESGVRNWEERRHYVSGQLAGHAGSPQSYTALSELHDVAVKMESMLRGRVRHVQDKLAVMQDRREAIRQVVAGAGAQPEEAAVVPDAVTGPRKAEHHLFIPRRVHRCGLGPAGYGPAGRSQGSTRGNHPGRSADGIEGVLVMGNSLVDQPRKRRRRCGAVVQETRRKSGEQVHHVQRLRLDPVPDPDDVPARPQKFRRSCAVHGFLRDALHGSRGSAPEGLHARADQKGE